MKEIYNEAEMEIIVLEQEDVITTSGNQDEIEGGGI